MFIYIIAAIAAFVVYFKYIRRKPEDYEILSEFYTSKCWTRGEEVSDTSIKPFEIKIPDSEIEDLYKRIDLTRYPPPALENAKFTYGVNDSFLREFVDYWRKSYSWQEQEKELNKYDHFKTVIEGLEVHFIHVKPKSLGKGIEARPLLLAHGWPGSFYEFYRIIPMLTDPASHGGNESDVFELVIPSIPGYGFSQAPEVKGFHLIHCARIYHSLMLRLGYRKYYAHGGDWGAAITMHMAMLYPTSVKGLHITNAFNGPSLYGCLKMLIGSLTPNWFFDPHEVKIVFPLKQYYRLMIQETGYMHIQATKPDTVGFALSNSPVGLAAYILEKFSTWTDPENREKNDGGLYKYWSKDELLNNIMIYWWTGSITSSMRFYKEAVRDIYKTANIKIRVPSGYAYFPQESFNNIKLTVVEKYTRLISFTYMKEGGHFASFQVPHLLINDIRQFVNKVERVKMKQEQDELESSMEIRSSHLDRYEKN